MADVQDHPRARDVKDFALGRLDSSTTKRVEAHLGLCPACLRVALKAPADRLVALIRRDAPPASPTTSKP